MPAPHAHEHDTGRPLADPTERELFHRLLSLDEKLRASEDAEAEASARYRRMAERRRIPPVPDMRFEYSYTRSVAQCVHVERAASLEKAVVASEKGKEKAVDGEEDTDEAGAVGTQEVVRVDWRGILWITTRDQVISPLLQGALWGVASHFLRPLGGLLGGHIREWWVRGGRGGKTEGNGAQWLRNMFTKVLTPTPAKSYAR